MTEKVNVVIPTIGESVSEGTIGRWFFKEGDEVKKDQPLFELDSDKATLEVPASATGKLSILSPAGKTVSVGATVAVIETGATGASKSANGQKKAAPVETSTPSMAVPTATSTPTTTSAPSPKIQSVSEEDLRGYSPSKRKAIREGSLEMPSSSSTSLPWSTPGSDEIRKPMSTLRKRIAARLVESQQTTATLTTFNEIDMTKVSAVRNKLKDKFQSEHGVKLGFMSFFCKAILSALDNYPEVGARIDGDEIVYPRSINLGIAVSTERGLVVPVLRNANKLSYGNLEKLIGEMAEKARQAKLQIADMNGGHFTITNGGTFGSLLSTPIINPPQSGILGMHKIENRPIAIADEKATGGFRVEVHPMMYVALSYDHRLIDGATSVGFLVKVKEYLETISEDKVV